MRLLSVVALCVAIAPADAQTLAGRWLAILDINGAVMPHAEELQVAADGAVKTIVYGIRRLPECDTAHFAETGACAPARPNISGTIARDVAKGTVAVDHMVPTRGAMEGIGTPFDERLAAELFWFGPGPPWKLGADGRALLMTRRSVPVIPNTELDGTKTITVEKRFYPVDEGFAADLVLFADGIHAYLPKFVCIMPFVSRDAPAAGDFQALMRDAVAVLRKREALFVSFSANPDRDAAMIARFAQVNRTLAAADGPPADMDMAAVAATLGLTADQVSHYVREIVLRPHASGADALMFSMLRANEAQIRGCYAQHFQD
jgi:hypothetical protein